MSRDLRSVLVGGVAVLFIACGSSEASEPTATEQAVAPTATVQALAPTATNASTGEQSMPTPDTDGLCRVLKFEQAQQIVTFDLVQPVEVSEPLAFDGVVIEAPMALHPSATPATSCAGTERVTLFYVSSEGADGTTVQLVETTLTNPPDAGAETVTIDGRNIEKSTIVNAAGETVTSYTWQQGEVTLVLFGITGDDVTEEDLERMIASIPHE